METGRAYMDYVPSHEWFHDEAADTLIVHVPGIQFLSCLDSVFVLSYNLFVCLLVFSGFKKEQLKVHIGSSGKLLVSGERPLIKDQWSRFSKEFQLPENCNADQVHGKLENGLLTIVLPKLHHRGGAAKGADAGKEEKEKGGVKRREGDAQRGTRTADAAAGNQASSDEKMKLKSTLSMDVPLHPHEGRLLVVGLLVAVVVVAWYLYQKLNPAETQRHGASPAI
ncbi:uncharacterized protein LOC141848648 [Curcuma longa]|uniref:uncharacterized protein LOC141848648 n=1 Tax=Curcuma longa TaxID=136217 RepID=UPI003D9F9659